LSRHQPPVAPFRFRIPTRSRGVRAGSQKRATSVQERTGAGPDSRPSGRRTFTNCLRMVTWPSFLLGTRRAVIQRSKGADDGGKAHQGGEARQEGQGSACQGDDGPAGPTREGRKSG